MNYMMQYLTEGIGGIGQTYSIETDMSETRGPLFKLIWLMETLEPEFGVRHKFALAIVVSLYGNFMDFTHFQSVNATAWVYTRQRGCLETLTFRFTWQITNFTVSKIQKFIFCANIQLIYKHLKFFENSNQNSNRYFFTKPTEIQLPLPMNGLPS